MKIHETFKSALHSNIFDGNVPAKQLADKIGKTYTYFCNAANESQPESHFQARDIIPLTLLSGSFALLDYIESQCGRVAFQLPRPDGEVSSLVSEIAQMTDEFGDVMHELSDAMRADSDGGRGVSRGELRRIERECDHLIRQVCRLRAAVLEEVEK